MELTNQPNKIIKMKQSASKSVSYVLSQLILFCLCVRDTKIRFGLTCNIFKIKDQQIERHSYRKVYIISIVK